MYDNESIHVLFIQSSLVTHYQSSETLFAKNRISVDLEPVPDLAAALYRLEIGGLEGIIYDVSHNDTDSSDLFDQISHDYPDIPLFLFKGDDGQDANRFYLWDGTQASLEHEVTKLKLLPHTVITAKKQKKLERVVHESEIFVKGVLNGLSAHIAVVDANGVIVAVNDAWRQFAADNLPIAINVLEGANYLEVCDTAQGEDSAEAAAFAAGLRDVLVGKRPYFELEYPCHSPHEPRWFLGRVTRIAEDAGAGMAIVAHENITARKLAELREQRFALATEQSPNSVMFTNLAGIIEYVNPALCALTGYTASELLGQTARLFQSGQTPVATYQQLWETITQGDVWKGEFLNKKKDGTLFWEAATVSPLLNSEGEITHFVGVKEDISQKKREIARLTASAQRYKGLFEHASDAIFVNDLNGRFLDANKVARKRFEYRMNELRELTLADIDPLEYSKPTQERSESVERDGYYIYETIHVSRNGRVIPTEVTAQEFEYDGQTAILSIGRDISERKGIIKLERESREFAEGLVKTGSFINCSLQVEEVLAGILGSIGSVIRNDSATLMLVDGEFAEIVEVFESNFIEKSPHTFLGSRMRIAEFSTLTTMRKTKQPIVMSHVTQFSDWVVLPALMHIKSYVGAPIYHMDELLGFVNLTSSKPGVFTQIDANRLQAFAVQIAIALENARNYGELETLNANLERLVQVRTEQVTYEKDLLHAILYGSPNAILLLGANEEIVVANSRLKETFQLTEERVLGKRLQDVLQIRSEALYKKMLKKVLTDGEPQKLETIVATDDVEFEMQIRMTAINSESVLGVVCTMLDITPFKIAERTKDAFISNVSHELKTPLTSIKLYSQLISRQPDKVKEYVAVIEREIVRQSQLIENLLHLSRLDLVQTTVSQVRVSLNDLITEMVADRQPMAEAAELTLTIASLAEMEGILTSRNLIGQVLSNLISNALVYTPANGQIAVSSLVREQAGMLWCGFSIQDSGVGIAPDEQSKVFERFYRSKESVASNRPGTGLGLAIASEIVAEQGGKIELQSDGIPGNGSTFTVWLPVKGLEK
jgi:PAS domain S-box-containing protein